MSGFKDDVISILRDNMMLHAEAMGLVLYGDALKETRELVSDLQKRKFPVTAKIDKCVFNFDYVIIQRNFNCTEAMIKAMSLLSRLGIIILDISDDYQEFDAEYKSSFGRFVAHRVQYHNRYYLVIRQGTDYGN